MVIWPNSTGRVLGWSPTKNVQMVLIGCICRSRGQKKGFQNAIFKNLLFWSYKAQSFHIWYIASSKGPLPKLFKLCPWGQNWPRTGGHNFTLNYIRKSSNDIFSWTAYGNLTKMARTKTNKHNNTKTRKTPRRNWHLERKKHNYFVFFGFFFLFFFIYNF